MPKISVVTVAHNASVVIEDTLRSVIFQTYPNIEYVVIDMRSRDETLEIIKNYSQHIHYWMSQTCENRFDAMNAGLKQCTGDFVLFLNAGHRLPTPETFSNCVRHADQADLIYSRAIYVSPSGATRPWHKPTPWPEKLTKRSFINGMVICPACMLVRRTITPPFQVQPWRHTNDLDWAIRVMAAVQTKYFYTGNICHYRDRPVPLLKRLTIVKERFQICWKHFGFPATLLEQFNILWQAILRGRIS